MKGDERALADLAASVADGTPIDWTSAEERASAPERRLISHLRLVESIATLHRSIPPDETEPIVSRLSATLPETAGPRWGRLVLLERIGEGASCEVHRAWDSDLHRDVALKLLHDEGGGNRDAQTRMLGEARRLARVRHVHVVQVFGAEDHDNRVGLWMEFVRGESLDQILKIRGPFGAREAALIGLDLCAALAAVHAAGLLHRDVKAQNVIRESGGRIVLMDFGTGEELAGTNRLVGTPLYLAPEIFRGQAASVQSDLYSLGVLLFWLVTGQFPVPAGSMEQLARAHTERKSQRLRDRRPDVPEAFVRVVERALDSDPARRYRTAGEMELALRESLDAQSAEVVRPIAPATPARRPRLGFAYLAAAAALVVIVAGLMWRTRGGVPDRVVPSAVTQTIAVLPLVEEAGSSAPSPFALGFTDELTATLGQISSLRVMSATAVMPFRDRQTPLPAIAQKLNADALLETTLMSGGGGAPGQPDPVRVKAQLFAAGSGTPMWWKAFERPRGETSALQSEIARAVATALNAPVTDTEAARFRKTRQTTPAAEEAYLQGRIHLADYGVDAARRALEAFQRANRLDAGHAAARAGAARAFVRLGTSGAISQADARASALSEARQALELDSELADAHAAQADIKFFYDWDWAGAERGYQRSLELNPSFTYARTYYGQYLAARGRFDEALTQTSTAQRLDPQSAEALRLHALTLYYKRDYPAAETAIRRAFEQDPDSASAHFILGRIAEARGRVDEAVALTERASELSGNGGVPLRVGVIRLQAVAGRTAEARTGLANLEKASAARTIRLSPRDRAYIRLALGQTDAALDAFEQALDERDTSLIWLGVDPRVDSLRDSPRFVAILRRIGLS